LRIVRELPPTIDDFSTSRFHLGGVYEVNAPLCDLLIASGYAVPAPDEPAASARAAKPASPLPSRVAADEARPKRRAKRRAKPRR